MTVLNCFPGKNSVASVLWTSPSTTSFQTTDHHASYSLLLASHSLRSISLGSTTSSLRSKSTTRIFVYSSSRYCFFSSAGFFPFGFAFDFLQKKKGDRLRGRYKRLKSAQQ